MTDYQRDLARHALGLPNKRKTTYRNRYVVGRGNKDYGEWQAMVAAGEAGRRDAVTVPFGGDDLFWLTFKGAKAAMQPGEKLDPEDIPT